MIIAYTVFNLSMILGLSFLAFICDILGLYSAKLSRIASHDIVLPAIAAISIQNLTIEASEVSCLSCIHNGNIL